ncbi:uncharacterized protein LOC117649237 isoform X2 [Thrips palmi]|uniref:Uncharacterized protein LOC117649237 isoform X2 n=1 Tax=Thrips palmi TaxID=161013 RepID=A0A6P8Z5I5_THRPL|nr:uncharacterized protein LOC117649237 isoform X2 [Thrips palmi]
MNEFKKLVLLDLEDNIKRDVTDVDVDDILMRLISKNVINSEEQRAVLGGKNKISELIKILLSKTEGNWYEEFASALENDYSWISKNLRSRFDNEVTEKLDFYLHGRGNVPPLPQHNIRRTKYIQPLRDKIRNLKRNSYLVVHGLSGLGKTYLVVDALNDVGLLENSLNGCVYWMSVGDLRNEELDKIQCLQLQKKLCTMSNLVINPQRDLSPDELLLELKRHFSLKPNNSSLLILDKVRCSKVIEILSVGCKILITSQDRDVVKDPYHRDFYEISEGFSEQESVQLLSDFVLDGTKELAPPIRECATKIHRMWKGHPMIIRLIGGELSETKEESQRDVARWQVYEKTAQHGTNGNGARRRSAHEEQVKDIIELTTKKLKSDFKDRLFMLAVLVEDANITKEVLKILWDVESHEVEKTMNTLYRRSLVLRKYVDKLKQPVYGIHDIIMEYLKKSVSKSDLINMHKDLMKKIYKFCHGDFSTLPEDSYIFSYLCHHVENANMWNTYRDQFFPLRYLERKLKATGSGDLLLDLHKYQSGLENNNEYYRSKMENIKSLVNDSGWDIHQGDVDIVQCALLQPSKSYIYVEGTVIANSNESSSMVYFYPTPTGSGKKPRDLKGNFDNVQAVSLVASNSASLADGRLLIYPDPEGLIAEIDMHYKGKRRSFREISHVVMLKMSPLRDKFLSALDNGYINIWSMTTESTSAADTPPPSLKQKSHQPFFEDTRSTPCLSFRHKHRVICASFSSDGRLVVSASADNVVCVWSIEKNSLLHELKLHPSPSATACSFVCNDTMIVYGCTDFHLYFFELAHSHKFETKIDGNYGRLVNLLNTQGEGRKLIIVQEKSVVLMSWELERLSYRVEGHREMELKNMRRETIYSTVSPVKINCAAYHQNNLVLGTCNNGLILFDVLSHQFSYQILASEEIKAVDIVNSQVVLAQNKTVIMLWPEPNKKLVVKQVESASLGWNTHHQKPLSVHAVATSDGNIQVFHDGKVIVDKLYPNTCFVRVCEQSDHVLIGTSTGVVALLDTVSSSIDTLFLLPSKITYLSVTMYENNHGRDYVYLATAKETDNSEVLVLKVRAVKKECKISSPVVKVFVHSQENCMIVTLRDSSILAWDLLSGCPPTSVVQGRVSAMISDASFSEEKSIIVLSDLENCFHQVHLKWPEKKQAAPYDSNHYSRLIIPKTNGTDVVDGMGSSPPLMDIVCGVSDTIPRSTLSWCCSMSPKGELVAIGHGECSVLVWNLKTKSTVFDFEVLPDRRRKVGQLQFSHNNVKMGKTQFELVLCVVTDCLSFYDLSSALNDNSRIGKRDSPERIGCVTASGNDIVEFSANSCFSKFCAFDISYSFFSWYVYGGKFKDIVL